MDEDYKQRKDFLKLVASKHENSLDKTKRIFLEEPSFSTKDKRESEYEIKVAISRIFGVEYHQVYFCGSAHLGFSPHKNKPFRPGYSDLDLAIISPTAFGIAFEKIIESTKSFTDETVFGETDSTNINHIKERIYRRGCILIKDIPRDTWAKSKIKEINLLARNYKSLFKNISVAVYISDYFYCWKQKSALDKMLRLGS